MKILVVGAGAVGSTLGGMLALSGHEVTLVGRDPHMRRIASSGLKIAGLWGEHHVTTLKTATAIPEIQPDWILLTVKAYDTGSAAQLLAQKFPKDIPILHLQNGMGSAEILAASVGWPRVISGMIIIGFQIPMAGRTVVTVSADKVKIGRQDGTMDSTVQDLVKTLNQAQIPSEAVADIQKQLWGKVLYNASLNALSGLLGVNYGALLDPHPWMIIQQIIQEAFGVLKAEGQLVAWTHAEAYLEHLQKVQIPATFEHKPSMFSDLRHGRQTEIDFINGALTALGRKHQQQTPVNDTIISMIHAEEEYGRKGVLHPSLQPLDEPSV